MNLTSWIPRFGLFWVLSHRPFGIYHITPSLPALVRSVGHNLKGVTLGTPRHLPSHPKISSPLPLTVQSLHKYLESLLIKDIFFQCTISTKLKLQTLLQRIANTIKIWCPLVCGFWWDIRCEVIKHMLFQVGVAGIRWTKRGGWG